MRKKLIVVLCAIIFISALNLNRYNVYSKYTKITPKAVYLVSKYGGQISQRNLKKHPEVLVVNTFEDLVNVLAKNKNISIWIDKNATNAIKYRFILRHNLLVVVGYNNALYSFRDKLFLDIEGPCVNWKKVKVGNGFSVWLLKSETPNSRTALMKGYSNKVTIENIFKVTDSYLKNNKVLARTNIYTAKAGKYFGKPYRIYSSFMPILTLENGHEFKFELGIGNSVEGNYIMDNNKLLLSSSAEGKSYILDITKNALIMEQEIPGCVSKGSDFKLLK